MSVNDPERFVLWIREPQQLVQPHVLLTAASVKVARDWRQLNRWADSIPLIALGGPEMAPMGRVFQAVPAAFNVADRVENAPRIVWEAWTGMPEPSSAVLALATYLGFCQVLAATLPKRLWVLAADADGGALACAIARVHGRCVALAGSPPGILAASFAYQLDVSISARDKSSAQ